MADVQQAVETAGPYGIAGAIAFAAIKAGPWLARIYDVLVAIWEQREIKNEQERRRDMKRRRAESVQPQNTSSTPSRHSKMPSLDAIPEHVPSESTDVIDIARDVKKRRPGLRAPTRGDRSDKPYGEDS